MAGVHSPDVSWLLKEIWRDLLLLDERVEVAHDLANCLTTGHLVVAHGQMVTVFDLDIFVFSLGLLLAIRSGPFGCQSEILTTVIVVDYVIFLCLNH